MDELELLKKDWQRNTVEYPELSYNEIYKMSHAKSSSIVKWIFYISLIEFGIGLLLLLINPKIEGQIQFPQWIEILSILTFPVIGYFIYLFYKNYINITATDNVKTLIKTILKTRRTVKYYVLFNLVMAGIFSCVGLYIGFVNSAGGAEQFNATAHFAEYAKLGLVIALVTGVIISFIYGIYYLLYGILLKRLNRNYKELKKLEV
ncbi:MAG: hypothetical protein ED556_14025 [Winogradskyella sp.]|uniref:hypothetical protein n=1 Tax=Winogradskyella sp. TaxID=1883156 RepID=UPI000F41DD07|nr:hypothetical protein [Winogradskyella sp.]RNC80218.1 MAG: hypothetical protein ED556_14025 [Winogradskyella sp.]